MLEACQNVKNAKNAKIRYNTRMTLCNGGGGGMPLSTGDATERIVIVIWWSMSMGLG